MSVYNPFGDEKLLGPDSLEFYFWLRHARRSEEPVVVLNAGTGRVAISLAKHAMPSRVIAVEGDEEKRRRGMARGKAAGVEMGWQAGEVASFALRQKAGMVALAEYAFEQLLTLDAQRAALRHLHQRLQIGGKLAFVLNVPDVQAMAASEGSTSGRLRRLEPLVEPKSGQTVYVWESSRYDLSQQRLSRHVVYEMVDQAGLTVRRWHRTFERAYFWPREVQLLLEGMKFDIEALYGGWNDEPFTNTSTQQVWIARKGI
ncbi:MAG: hypothetical protein ACPGWR_28270 [Ardenticatenaceae bacterium]